ncbi:MAG: tripartite tricarboxylate transporter substrate binding protein [Burkholderiales bacterium]|nr:tripartite tricarboxylate transporter substrate binding protein [Burkholderiales bacterium]
MNIRTSYAFAALACWAFVLAHEAGAQAGKAGAAETWPVRPIRLIVPFPPGGATDANARVVARGVESLLGQSVVVDNRGGANAIIGSEMLARATPDGYTLMHISVAFAINPGTHLKLPFDTRRDFTPITNPLVGQGALLACHPSLPVKSVTDLIALAKKHKLSFSSPGVGNVLHLIATGFMSKAGIAMLHVPYKGAGPALTALIGGEVQAMVVPVVIAMPHLKAGRVRPLGYSGAKRLPALPDVPTIGESALPGFAMDTGWHAWFGPAKLPPHVVKRVYAAVAEAVKAPALRDLLAAGGYQPVADPPAVFQKNFLDDLKHWGELARLAGIEPQ